MILYKLAGKGHEHSNDESCLHTTREIWRFVSRFTTDCGTTGSQGTTSTTDTPTTSEEPCFPPLHVDGKNLVDPNGNKVVLHGVMDTPNQYFNGWRWGFCLPYDDNAVAPCLAYFTKIFDAITDSEQGAECKLFRLHLDPAWTNTASADGEADISKFSAERLRKYLQSLYLPIVKDAIAHGLYVIMRPPGVCPQVIKVNDAYNDYLKTVWDIVSNDAYVKQNSGYISLELANEPIQCQSANGMSQDNSLHDFFQPIVDLIRSNGYEGVVWIPGTGYQSDYKGYAKYPITDNNYGYAVHIYPGWYGQEDGKSTDASFIQGFKDKVPVVDSKPIVVTEYDWSHGNIKRDANGNIVYKYDGNPDTDGNWGTWGTATTSGWGSHLKAYMDHYGNMSMTLQNVGSYLDYDSYFGKFDGSGKRLTPETRIVRPFGYDKDNPDECSGVCMKWYKEWAKVDHPICEADDEIFEMSNGSLTIEQRRCLYVEENTSTSTMKTL